MAAFPLASSYSALDGEGEIRGIHRLFQRSQFVDFAAFCAESARADVKAIAFVFYKVGANPPTRSFFSMSLTFTLFLESSRPAAKPAGPVPRIIILFSDSFTLFSKLISSFLSGMSYNNYFPQVNDFLFIIILRL